MLKTEKAAKAKHRDKAYLSAPRSTQDIIPADTVYEDGMFLCNGEIYSQTYRFTDINYLIADFDQKKGMISSLRAIAKSCTTAEISQITIVNRHINDEMMAVLKYPMKQDGYDGFRAELNAMLEEQSGRGTGIIQDRYYTASVVKPTPKAARMHFDRIGTELSLRFAEMGSHFSPVSLSERLRLLHDFYRPGDENYWSYDFKDKQKKKHSFKDSIAPMSIRFSRDHFEIGGKYGRVLAMTEYANNIDDRTLTDLTALDAEMVLSVSFLPIPTDEAVKYFQAQLDKVEKNSAQTQYKQMQRIKIALPEQYNYRKDREAITEMLNDITVRDCGLVIATITIAHLADSLEQLDSDTELIRTTARDKNCELNVCTDQQLDALNTALPYGLDRISMDRSLSTESLAAFMPFNAQEICDPRGVFYGTNAITRNLVVIDRMAKSSGNGFILGMTGGGKSFFCKSEITALRLRYPPEKADFLILDPENEYARVVKKLGGEVYNVGSDSINPFDIELDMQEKNPLAYKTEFITTFCEKIAGETGLDAQSKSLIDRAVRKVYAEYLKAKGAGAPPLLGDFKTALQAMNHEKAKELSLALERFVEGTLNTFSLPTNINSQNSLLCYNLSELRDQMKPLGLLITLDQLLSRVMRNYKQGKITFVYCDEFSLLFQDEETGTFFGSLWKRIRKYNGFCTGATQNVEEVLDSDSGRAMLANTDFVVMLNQSPTNAEKLAELYKISQNQEAYFRDVPPGHGLIKVGGALVPFIASMPKDTSLYRLISTNPREAHWD